MITKLELMIYTVGLVVRDRVEDIRSRDRESGGVTLEQAMWALGVIVIAGIAFAVVKGFVSKNTDNIEKSTVLK